MLKLLITVLLLLPLLAHGRTALEEACSDRYCPIGTFCDLHNVACTKSPCKPMTICLPEKLNGCNSHPKCPAGQICVEHRTSCISRSCKKETKCAAQGTCDAIECPPSQTCIAKPKPHCVKKSQ